MAEGIEVKRRRYPSGTLCAVEGCTDPRRKREWCASHYSQWKRLGTVRPFIYKWSPRSLACIECGGAVSEGSRRRHYCSGRCEVLASNRRLGKGARKSVICVDCGTSVDIRTIPGERKIRSDRRRCTECRSRKRHRLSRRRRVSIAFLKRLGDTCALCDGPVDFSSRAPHPDSPSLDHRVPLAAGGADDETNVQLAHLRCNQIKGKRQLERVSRG